jgi:F420 biosynthesis protein FbiB-like protein
MTSDLHAFLRSRRSIRRFFPDPIPESVLQRILETATYAPSAHDKQPWRLVVVTSADSKLRLAKAVTAKFRLDMLNDGTTAAEIQARVDRTVRRTGEAPCIVILCKDITKVNPQPDTIRQKAETSMGTQSVALAGLQLLLAAHAEGLGGTWICWPLFAREEISREFELSPDWEPQGMIFLGYPAEQPVTPPRKPLREIVRYL